jgi:hypothetical protein
MARFGPTIWAELIAAGLGDEAITIEGDNLTVGANFPKQKGALLAAVLRDHDPTRQPPAVVGPVETTVRAFIDENLIPAAAAARLLKRVAGK